ncbi:MAG: CapA family protein [Myxococcaceae bacterium]
MGFSLVGRANNHTTDWGVEGMRETDQHLDLVAGLVQLDVVGASIDQKRDRTVVEYPRVHGVRDASHLENELALPEVLDVHGDRLARAANLRLVALGAAHRRLPRARIRQGEGPPEPPLTGVMVRWRRWSRW